MRIDGAIKHLENMKEEAERNMMPYRVEAIQLSIEAMRLLAEQPATGYTCVPRPLPGETEE